MSRLTEWLVRNRVRMYPLNLKRIERGEAAVGYHQTGLMCRCACGLPEEVFVQVRPCNCCDSFQWRRAYDGLWSHEPDATLEGV